MIIFLGTRQVVRDDVRPGGGMRHCPRCGQDAMFTPRRSRTYLHVFWLPILPLGQGKPVEECMNCKSRFETIG